MFKKLMAAVFSLALVATVFAEDKKPEKDIVETAVGNKNFSKLVAAVKAAELVDTLKGTGPFTVFAPTDKAFEALGEDTLKKVLADKETLTKILMVHVVKDKAVMAADVVKMDGKEVSNGYMVKVDGETVMLVRGETKVKVVKTDIKCKNGVIHVIDTVLMPKKD
ncbi:MAG: fasciclin domain-containing protein [Fimbriiglobus sp.]